MGVVVVAAVHGLHTRCLDDLLLDHGLLAQVQTGSGRGL